MILTYNHHDFLPLSEAWLRAGRSHAGIVISYRQYARREIGALCRAVAAMVEASTDAALHDTVTVLDQFSRG